MFAVKASEGSRASRNHQGSRRGADGARLAHSGRGRAVARGDAAVARAVLESLEERRLFSVAVTGSVTLDESAGLQNSGTAVGGEDNNDNDVALGTLQSQAATFYNRLFGTGAGQLALSTSFPTQNGVAKSADNFITVSGAGSIVSLGFSTAAGQALPVYGGATPGVASGLSAVNGGAISLYADPVLGNRMVLGVDGSNDIVTAMFMDPAAGLASAKVWTVQFEPLGNPDATNPDDAVSLSGLGAAVGVSTEFNFNALPSGQNLFGTVGDTTNALVVIGKTPVLNPDGSFTNASDTINTSQGGGPTTIGVNNQMFDAGEGAYFTFVKTPVADFLAGAVNGLDQNEADDADNIQYTGGTIEANGGFVKISQIQGNSTATMDVTLFNMAGTPQGQSFARTGLGTGSAAPVTSIKVFDANGVQVANPQVTFGTGPSGNKIPVGTARVAGLGAGFKIAWTSSAVHDQVLIGAVGGKFDIGGFGVDQPSAASTPLTGIRYEDDGPTISGTITGAATLTVDESNLALDASGNFAPQFTSAFGTDGAAAAGSVTYALATPGGDSGLVDTATGQAVKLSLAGGQIQGRTATSNDLVFTVSVDSTGKVTLDQLRAVVHPDTTNPDDSKTLLAANLVKLTATAADKDADTAAATLDIGQQLVLKDDGPSISGTITGAPTLTVDESDLPTDASGNFAGQFTSTFGADGAGATPVAYALSTPGGASGLVDTATGEAVNLSSVAGQIQGRTATTNLLVFTVSVDSTGKVTLDQQRAVVHPDTTNPDDSKTLASAGLVKLTATATDKDGDSAAAALNIGQQLVIKDDGPSISATITGAPTLTVDESNLATNASGNFAPQFSPSFGADGAGATAVSYALSTPGGNSGLVDTATGQNVVLSLVGGQIQGRTATSNDLVFTVSVDATGKVTLDQLRAVVHPDATNADDSVTLSAANLVVLTATATDKDGDAASAPLNIGQQLVIKDDGPAITASIVNAPTLTVDESNLALDASAAFAAQFSPIFGADGPAATPVLYALSTPGGSSGLIDTATGEAVNLSLVGGQVQGMTAVSNQLAFTVSVDANGNVTLDQIRAIVHADTTNPDDSRTLATASLVKLTATATDKDGDTASAPLNIGQQLVLKDDGPSITGTITGAPVLPVDESVLATDASGGYSAQFTPTFGADGAGATPVGYALSTPGGASGLVDTATGEAVNLSLVSGQIRGRTATTNLLVFTVDVSAAGVVSLDQIRSVVHPDTTNPDDSKTLSAANLVVLTATATDKDGDTASASLNVGQQLVFNDDGPGIGPIANSIVDFINGASVTKTLNGVVGADPNGTPYTVSNFTGSITVNGVTLQGVLANDKQSVTYWADTSNDTIFGNTGDTAYYKLTLGESGAGTYTFQVLVDPPPALINFNFNDLPSGQNLFGTVGDTTNALVVIGKTPVLNPDGTFTNASDTINTSQGGGPTTIGINNQMFDAGEGAYFTFVKTPVADFLAGAVNGLDQNEADDADNIQYTGGTLETTNGFTSISQIQGNSLATMDIKAFNMAGTPQGQSFARTGLGTGSAVSITVVRVFNASGGKIEDTALPGAQDPNVVVTFTGGVARVTGLGAGYRIEWDTSVKFDQVLIQDVAGKFDIGGFGTTQGAPTPDQKLDFVVRVTDGDGDSATAGFSIGIDGTGAFHDGHVTGVATAQALFGSDPITLDSQDALADLLA